jgi:hypothetical protein
MTETAMLVLALVVAISSWILVVVVSEPVSFERLDRFARRQRLWITPANAAIVMRYLATTHRWRAAGVATALCYTVAAGLHHHRYVLSLNGIFAGWFIGAIVAEWRLNAPPRGTRRYARLIPRRPGSYLSVAHRTLLWITTALALGVGTLDILYGAGDRYAPRAQTFSFTLLAVLSIATYIVVGRHIVHRPQAAETNDDTGAADDALRARSLRVLCGSTVAMATTATAALILVSPILDGGTSRIIGFTVQVAGLLAGWYLAAARPPATAVASAAVLNGPTAGQKAVTQ